MNENKNLKRTPLYDEHVKLGGKIVPFAGWELPVLYSGVIPEHLAVRTKAGLFDVSHMGEIFVTGPEAEKAIDEFTCNDLKKLVDGKAIYSAIINDNGGVVDDIIIYRFNRERFLICVNASNSDKDFEWFASRNHFDAHFEDRSSQFGQIALQGPHAVKILGAIAGTESACELKYFHFCEIKLAGSTVIAARTGYTGEDGFEFFIQSGDAVKVWNQLLEVGAKFGLEPCGLGARDTLRLESCYPLHGHELSDEITAIESGLAWIVKPDKGDFIGREVLKRQKSEGAPRSLIGFLVDDAGIVREGSKVLDATGSEIGYVTSGTKTPTINRALGMALVKSEFSSEGCQLQIDVRGRLLKSHVVKKPFYTKSK